MESVDKKRKISSVVMEVIRARCPEWVGVTICYPPRWMPGLMITHNGIEYSYVINEDYTTLTSDTHTTHDRTDRGRYLSIFTLEPTTKRRIREETHYLISQLYLHLEKHGVGTGEIRF